jgi:N-acetylglucosaminyl-diphospho-decaprenol L-rhamnosyltransferase
MALEKRSFILMVVKYIPEWIKEPYRRVRARLLSIGLDQSMEIVHPREEILASNDVSVIIAIHDSPKVTRRCLESVEKYGAKAQIILVDDGSKLQETIDIIRYYQQRNGWAVIRHDKALGHSRSCEAGSRFATKPYLCFLNSDTVVTPWSWRGAKEAFYSDPRIAVTGPATSRASTKQTVRRADYCRHYWTDSQICAFAERYISKQYPRSWVDVPDIDGFAFFIRRSVWDELGGFHPDLPDYGNETELCKRVLMKGYRIVFVKNSYIHHFGASSMAEVMSPVEIRTKHLSAQRFINNLYDSDPDES